MKNYLTYLIIAGGLYYYFANKKKQDQLKQLQIKPLEPIETKPKILKNIAKKVIPKVLPVIQKNFNEKFNPLSFQSKLINKDFLQKVKDFKETKKPYNFQYLRPGTIKGTFPDLC